MIKIFCDGKQIDAIESNSLVGSKIKSKTFLNRLTLPTNIPCITLPIGVVSMAIETGEDWIGFKKYLEEIEVSSDA